MKKLITFILLIAITGILSATNYYLKNGGNDAASGLDDDNAWASIVRANDGSYSAGDSILFKRGDTFYGTLIPPSAGSSGDHIIFDAYGTGAKPILTPNNIIGGITWSAYGAEGIYSTTDIPYNPGNCLINWGSKINKINDNWFDTPNPTYSNWTSLEMMRIPTDTSWTMNDIADIEFWDALDALFCYDDGTGTTYIRFRDGEDPNDSILAFSAEPTDSAAIYLGATDFITLRNLHILGGSIGVRIFGHTSTERDRVVVDSCIIKSSDQKIRIGSSSGLTVKNCDITNDYLSAYSPGAWEDGTEYEHGVKSMYYIFWKYVIAVSSSDDACSAINMSGGQSDSCDYYNNTITECVNGIGLFGFNMNCYGNSITGTSSVGIYMANTGPTHSYDNELTDVNIGLRFGSVDLTTYEPNPTHYVYRNTVYNPDAGDIMFIHYSDENPSVTTAYIYHNSFICRFAVRISYYASSSPNDGSGLTFVNNIISSSFYASGGFIAMYQHDSLFIWDYNWTSGTYYGWSSSVWVPVPNNIEYTGGPTFWDHSVDPPDFTDLSGSEAIDAGIDVSQPFTLWGDVEYSALPDSTNTSYLGYAFDIGAVEYDPLEDVEATRMGTIDTITQWYPLPPYSGADDDGDNPYDKTFSDTWAPNGIQVPTDTINSASVRNDSLVWTRGNNEYAIAQTTGPAGFRPDSLSNLVLYLSGGDGVTHSAAGISSWEDQSSSGHDAVQNTASDRPAYGLNTLNGVYIMTPDGSNDAMRMTDHTSINDFTMFFVLEFQVATDYPIGNHSSIQNYIHLSTTECKLRINATDVDFTISTTADYHILEITRDNSDDINVWVDGVASSSNPLNNVDIWGLNELFKATSNFGSGDIGELIIYSEEKSSGDRTSVREYLEDKYGL